MPKIFVFSCVSHGGDGPCYVMAEDGIVLKTKRCTEDWARTHLINPDCRYEWHYPGGYEMEFIPSSEKNHHDGFKRAYALNEQAAEKAQLSHFR